MGRELALLTREMASWRLVFTDTDGAQEMREALGRLLDDLLSEDERFMVEDLLLSESTARKYMSDFNARKVPLVEAAGPRAAVLRLGGHCRDLTSGRVHGDALALRLILCFEDHGWNLASMSESGQSGIGTQLGLRYMFARGGSHSRGKSSSRRSK